jgi:hypothetical protein
VRYKRSNVLKFTPRTKPGLVDDRFLVSEYDHQKKAFEWIQDHTDQYPELDDLYAIPNGGRRPPKVAREMKETGQKKGMPDVHLPIPRGKFASLYVELKKPGGSLSPDQKKRHPRLARWGNRVVTVYSWADLIITALDYLGYAIPKELEQSSRLFKRAA